MGASPSDAECDAAIESINVAGNPTKLARAIYRAGYAAAPPAAPVVESPDTDEGTCSGRTVNRSKPAQVAATDAELIGCVQHDCASCVAWQEQARSDTATIFALQERLEAAMRVVEAADAMRDAYPPPAGWSDYDTARAALDDEVKA